MKTSGRLPHRLRRKYLLVGLSTGILAAAAGMMCWMTFRLDLAPHVERAGGVYQAFQPDPLVRRIIRRFTGGRAGTQYMIRFAPGRVTDDWLEKNRFRLDVLDTVSLSLRNPAITDTGVEQLATATGVIWLDLSQTQVTDAGISFLTNLSDLTLLELENTRITDGCLPVLTGLPALSAVNVAGTCVTDRGIAAFPAARLSGLGIDSSQFTELAVQSPAFQTTFLWFALHDATDESVARLAGLPLRGHLRIQGGSLSADSYDVIAELIRGGGVHAVVLRDIDVPDAQRQRLQQVSTSCTIHVETTEEAERRWNRSRLVSNDSLF